MSAVNPVNVPADIAVALKDAAKATGTGFDFLMQTAMRESGLNSAANASTSSAVGLFQFIEGTWMETLKTAGPEHGLNEIAAAIEKTPSGRYNVSDPNTKAAILALRTDPGAAALMAGELAQSNAAKLQDRLGRAPTSGELYIAHFLGAGGAGQLISAAATTPDETAAKLFPRAAKANAGIFYNRGGKARTVGQVYQNLVSRHQNGDGTAVPVVVANKGASSQRQSSASGPRDITPDLAKAGKPGRSIALVAHSEGRAETNNRQQRTDSLVQPVAQSGAEQTGANLYSVAAASTDRPLFSLFRPVTGSPQAASSQSPALSALAMQTEGSPKPSNGAPPQALLATLKAYGMAVDRGQSPQRSAPLDISPGAWGSKGRSGQFEQKATQITQATSQSANKLWDGGLFTTGKTRAMASSGGLFATPSASQ